MATIKRAKFGKRTTRKTLAIGDVGVENRMDVSVIYIDEQDDNGQKVRHTIHLTSAERERLVASLSFDPT